MTVEPFTLFLEMRRVRSRMYAALDRRLWPRDQAELYFLLGCLNSLMASAANALGYPQSAEPVDAARVLPSDHGSHPARVGGAPQLDRMRVRAFMDTGQVFSGKWQATLWPGTSSASGGSVVRQISCAFQHRVWNRHAGGGVTGLGTSPVSRMRFPRPRLPGLDEGTADSSATV